MARLLPGVWELFGAGVHVANHRPQFSKAANKVPTLDLRQLNPGHTEHASPMTWDTWLFALSLVWLALLASGILYALVEW